MAINISAYDLQNYPDNGKTITVDLKSVVPTGAQGDEEYVLSADTNVTASGSATIQETFISDAKIGWALSSNRNTGSFVITESTKSLKVAIDEDISGAVTIDITTSASSQTGDSIAADVESKLKATTVTGGAKDGNLAYLNARCYYVDGRFAIVSGSASSTLTGSTRSSVSVASADSNDASETLGFDTVVQSVDLAGYSVTETYVTSDVSSSTTVPVASVVGFAVGDCVSLKTSDGTIYYRYLDNVSSPNLTVNAAVTVGENSMVQLLRMQDPRSRTASYYQDVDSIMRHAIEKIVRQIDFSS